MLKYVVTEYTSTFDKSTLQSVMSILIADMVRTPCMYIQYRKRDYVYRYR